MDKQKGYKIFLSIVLLIILLITLVISIVAYTYAAESDDRINFDRTDVLEDLLQSTVNGKKFDIRDYPIDVNNTQCRVINFVEYCYSYDPTRQNDYGLYIYVYNPSLKDIVVDSNRNKISIAVSYNDEHEPDDYLKFDLIFCDKSDDAYERLFYKFKVKDDGKIILNNVNSHLRRYDVAEIELLTRGNANATAYYVGGSYRFSGYAKGYGVNPEAESTLQCTVYELETIYLQVKDTFYRFKSYPTLHDQINSVYFAIPNYYLERYGRLQKIKAEWWEYKTQPIIVTSNYDVYRDLSNWIGVDIGVYNSDVGWVLYYGYNANYFWTYNFYLSPPYAEHLTRLTLLFYTGGTAIGNYTLDGDVLKQYIYYYNKSAANGYLPIKDGTISADLFTSDVDEGRTRGYNVVEIDADETFDLISIDADDDDYLTLWEWILVQVYGLEVDNVKNITPIYQVKPSDLQDSIENISRNLLITENDVSEFRTYCNDAFASDKTPFLFRFAVTDYNVCEITVEKDVTFPISHSGWAYKAQETVFLDFDIIQLTFIGDGKYYVIPAVQSPLDIVGDITPPPNSPTNDITDITNWLLLIITAVIVMLIVIIVIRLIQRFV